MDRTPAYVQDMLVAAGELVEIVSGVPLSKFVAASVAWRQRSCSSISVGLRAGFRQRGQPLFRAFPGKR
jgi:hypothetical protein